MPALTGSILALKILTDANMTVFLDNKDNKIIKNQRKTASSSYPPRSLNKQKVDMRAHKPA